MSLISLDKAMLAYGMMPLLDNVSMTLSNGDRVGLIGRNGSGKSTLLKVLAGVAMLDDGSITKSNQLRLAYVAQEPDFAAARSVFAAVSQGLGEVQASVLAYHEALHALADADDTAMQQLAEAQAEMERHNGWTANSRVEAALSRLGLDPDADLAALSGGMRKRVALARALVSDPNVLLLDEPTNHLDLDGILWLEKMLADFNGAILVVTHDRSFLDRVANRIAELDRGRMTFFIGNFSAYREKKLELLATELDQARKFDKVLAQEEVWIRQGVQARCTRNEGRVRRLEQLRRERAQRRERIGNVRFAIDAGERSGKLVAELKDVSKQYGDKRLISHFSTLIMRGDKIGLVGPNGVGKTTLLKLILGDLAPDSGEIRHGTRLQVAYFDQLRAQLDDNATLADTISQGSEFIEINGERKHVVSYLGDFLFAPQRVRAPVKSLSGGERNRLLLARLFTRPANVLVLDEPTNDLDIETLELLESLLQEFSGTVFLVSHDRTFLDNVVTQVIAFEGEGRLQEYPGGYDDYVRGQNSRAAAPTAAKPAPAAQKTRQPARKLSFSESHELDQLPARIEALELEQARLTARLAEPSLYQSASESAADVQRRFAEVERELATALLRWEELEHKKDSLGAS